MRSSRRADVPRLSFVVQYGVGGVNEHLGTTGTAHLLEHLFFKGTRSLGTRNAAAEQVLFERMDVAHDTLVRARARSDWNEVQRLTSRISALEDSARGYVEANEYDRILTKAGARGLNATTSNDATTYFVELPSNRAELWFVLEGDRMANPVFREFYTERDVVMEERRMRVETSPGGLLYEGHLAAAYNVHPYGVPVVGEVDFVVLRAGRPQFAVECKTGERAISAAVRYAAERTPIPHFYQVHRGDRHYALGRVTVLPFVEFCRQLDMP